MTSLWTLRTGPAAILLRGVVYGNGKFVAVAQTGTGNRAMYSTNGINWTSTSPSPDRKWQSVVYAGGQFVAVASGIGNGTGDGTVMTSPDGITWTNRTVGFTNDRTWRSVTYGNGLYVAVASTPSATDVMTSPDGITWTLRTAEGSSDKEWYGITYGNGLFVAVSIAGVGNRVMVSSDGINWTSVTSADNSMSWRNICYGNGLFVAVATAGSGNRVMTSTDGTNWTSRTAAANEAWSFVTYANGQYVAVSTSGTGTRAMYSYDGINWTLSATPSDARWYSVAYGNGLVVAVADSQTVNNIMTATTTTPTFSNFGPIIKTCSAQPFQITPPTSNSTGAFTYTSSNQSVATISGSIVTIHGPGTTTITATQAADSNYAPGSVTTTLTVANCPVQRIGYNTWGNCGTSGRTGQVVALGKNRATIASIGRVYKYCNVATNNGTSQNTFYCMFGPKLN